MLPTVRESGSPLQLAIPTAADGGLVAAQEGREQIDWEGEEDGGVVLRGHFT